MQTVFDVLRQLMVLWLPGFRRSVRKRGAATTSPCVYQIFT